MWWQMSTVLDVGLHLQYGCWFGRAWRRLLYGWWRACSVVLRITVTKGLPAFFHVSVGWLSWVLVLFWSVRSMVTGDDRRVGVNWSGALLHVRLEYGRMSLCSVQYTSSNRWHFRSFICVVGPSRLRTCRFVFNWNRIVVPRCSRTRILRVSIVVFVRSVQWRFLDACNFCRRRLWNGLRGSLLGRSKRSWKPS